MHYDVIIDDDVTYTRITKHKARALWGTVDMALCPVNLRPGRPWTPHITVRGRTIQEGQASPYRFEQERAHFDTVVESFELCNCTCNETGYYTAFYLLKERSHAL